MDEEDRIAEKLASLPEVTFTLTNVEYPHTCGTSCTDYLTEE